MKYIVKMSDRANDKNITVEINASSVFDAIDKASDMLTNPDEVELIEALPMQEDDFGL